MEHMLVLAELATRSEAQSVAALITLQMHQLQLAGSGNHSRPIFVYRAARPGEQPRPPQMLGGPPTAAEHEQEQCPYAELGVENDTPSDNIARQFKKLALSRHPDKGGSAELMGRLTDAHKLLRDSDVRSVYDALGLTAAKAVVPHAAALRRAAARTGPAVGQLQVSWFPPERTTAGACLVLNGKLHVATCEFVAFALRPDQRVHIAFHNKHDADHP